MTRSAAPDTGVPLIDAATHGFWWMLEQHIKEAPDVNLCDQSGRNALHLGAISPHTGGKAMGMLVDAGVDPSRRCRSLGRTPLLYACDDDAKLEAVEALLRSKRTEVDSADHSGTSALHVACASRAAAVARTLLRAGASVNQADLSGRTPLFVACDAGCCEVVLVLLAAGAELAAADGSGLLPAAAALRALRLRALHFMVRGGMEAEPDEPAGRNDSADASVCGGFRAGSRACAAPRLQLQGRLLEQAQDITSRLAVPSAFVTASCFVGAVEGTGISLESVWLLPAAEFVSLSNRCGLSHSNPSKDSSERRRRHVRLPGYRECRDRGILVSAAAIPNEANVLFVSQPQPRGLDGDGVHPSNGEEGSLATVRAYIERRKATGHRYEFVWLAACCLDGGASPGSPGAAAATAAAQQRPKSWSLRPGSRAAEQAEAQASWQQKLSLAAAVLRASHVLVVPRSVYLSEAGVSLTDVRACLRDGWCRLHFCCALLGGVPVSCFFQCGVASQFKHVLAPRLEDLSDADSFAGSGDWSSAIGGSQLSRQPPPPPLPRSPLGSSTARIESPATPPPPPGSANASSSTRSGGRSGQGYLGFWSAAHQAKRVLRTQSGQVTAEMDRLWFDADGDPLELLCRTSRALLCAPTAADRQAMIDWARKVASGKVAPLAACPPAAGSAAAMNSEEKSRSRAHLSSGKPAAAGVAAVPTAFGRRRSSSSGSGSAALMAALLPCFDAAGGFADAGDGTDGSGGSERGATLGAQRQLAVATLLLTIAYCAGLLGLSERVVASLEARGAAAAAATHAFEGSRASEDSPGTVVASEGSFGGAPSAKHDGRAGKSSFWSVDVDHGGGCVIS